MSLDYVPATEAHIPKPTREDVLKTAIEYFSSADAKLGYMGIKEGTCQYRVSGGGRCAVGALIPDELYKDTMHGGVVSLLAHHKEIFPGWWEDDELVRLLENMQRIHDRVAYTGGTPRDVAMGLYGLLITINKSAAVPKFS